MKKALLFGFSLLITLTYFAISREIAEGKRIASNARVAEKAEGWWLLHEYHDRIMNNRKVGEFSFEPPVWDAIVIQITADSVFSAGTVYPLQVTSREHGDTIRIGGMNAPEMFFIFKKNKKELTVEFTNSAGAREVFHYRRFRSNEYVSLTKNLFDRKQFWPLRTNYHKWWTDYLLAGTYTSVEDKSTLILGADEAVTGFEKWPAYKLDDFFGTIHWTEKVDRVRFEVPDKTGMFKDYNWRWSNDTLILRPYIGQSIESYKIGQKEFKYVRNLPN